MPSRIVTIIKQPGEVLRVPMSFSGVLTITSVEGVDVTPRGAVGGSPLIATPELFASALTLVLSGGLDGEQYLVSAQVIDASGSHVAAELDVAVLDAAWTMPDGGAPYLTIAEFVDRFGLPEVVAMTDGVGDGRIDRALLVSALVDAQATADAHMAGRYAVPLATVPQVVKMWVADLARARLYPRGAPEGVADQAKQSMRMLERVAAGTLPLPAAEQLAAPAASDTPILNFSGGRTYPDNLTNYP